MNQSGFIYGGDYNPEQWLAMPEILEQDIEYMKEAHINEVTLGVFSWSVLEPEEGCIPPGMAGKDHGSAV